MEEKMVISKEKKNQINALVDELTKQNPNLVMVKTAMQELGLEYSEDPVERLNTVLMSLHRQIHDNEAMKDL